METPSKGSRAGPIVLWVLSALLAVLYLAAGGSKLAGAQQHVEHFAKWDTRAGSGSWSAPSKSLRASRS